MNKTSDSFVSCSKEYVAEYYVLKVVLMKDPASALFGVPLATVAEMLQRVKDRGFDPSDFLTKQRVREAIERHLGASRLDFNQHDFGEAGMFIRRLYLDNFLRNFKEELGL